MGNDQSNVQPVGHSDKHSAVRVFLDSGAFGAYNRHAELGIDSYIDYIKSNRQWIWQYVSLDVIPGRRGRPRSQRERDESARQSYDNLQEMKSHGLSPIPVFHAGESFYWLDRMIADGEPYIGLSIRKGLDAAARTRWLTEAFSRSTDAKRIKFHAFGMLNFATLSRYPWASADATTWTLEPANGKLWLPQVGADGEFSYRHRPIPVITSGRIHRSKTAAMRLETLGPTLRDRARRFLHDAGLTFDDVRSTPGRCRAMLHYFRELQKALGVTIIFATSPDLRDPILNDMNANCRLLSYFELQNKPIDFLSHYVATGYPPRGP